MSDITRLISRMEQGEVHAADQLLPLVYEELRRLAAYKMAKETPGQTLQPTALVHEAWLRLGADAQPGWQSRGHFFAAAAEAMHRILVDRARRRARMKHGGKMEHVDWDDFDIAVEDQADDTTLQVHEALEKFAASHPQKATLVKMRYFVGLTFEEAAQALGIGLTTAKDWWSFSRAWLSVEMGRSQKM